MLVLQFLDGTKRSPRSDDTFVRVRMPDPVREPDAVTVYLADGTALVVRERDLVQLVPADPEE